MSGITIKPTEVRDIMLKVQRYHSLETIDKIIDMHPERIDEFGLDRGDFQTLKQDINKSQKECQDWWDNISKEYNLPHDSGFQVDYGSCTLELI